MSDIDYMMDIRRRYEAEPTDSFRPWVPAGHGYVRDQIRRAERSGYRDSTWCCSQFAAVGDEKRRDTFLWRYERQTLERRGMKVVPQFQQDGTCVGQGFMRALRTTLCVQHELNRLEYPGNPSVAGCYAGGRVDVGGQVGSWDGSNGPWTAEWLHVGGVVLLSDVGLPEDSLRPDEVLARQWAASRDGVPKPLEERAKRILCGAWSIVKTPEEAGLFIQNGYPVTNCSNIWSEGALDENGFFRDWSRHRGGHCQFWCGVRWNAGGTVKGLFRQNSWGGNFGSGGKRWPEDMPDGGGWDTRECVQATIDQEESIAISVLEKFPPPASPLSYEIILAA